MTKNSLSASRASKARERQLLVRPFQQVRARALALPAARLQFIGSPSLRALGLRHLSSTFNLHLNTVNAGCIETRRSCRNYNLHPPFTQQGCCLFHRPRQTPQPLTSTPPGSPTLPHAMDTTARLARLRLQTQADLDKLPNQPLPAAGTQEKIDRSSSDDDANGGVTLSASYTNIKRPALEPATDEANPPKKSPSTCPESNTERRFMWAKDATSSHNLGSSPSLPPLPPTPVAKLPPATLQKGDLAPAHLRYFTPLLALAKYPYKFCTKNLMQDIASGFFDAGKFWAREWDL